MSRGLSIACRFGGSATSMKPAVRFLRWIAHCFARVVLFASFRAPVLGRDVVRKLLWPNLASTLVPVGAAARGTSVDERANLYPGPGHPMPGSFRQAPWERAEAPRARCFGGVLGAGSFGPWQQLLQIGRRTPS